MDVAREPGAGRVCTNLLGTAAAFKGEGVCDDTDCEVALLLGEAGYHRRGTAAGASTHTRSDEHLYTFVTVNAGQGLLQSTCVVSFVGNCTTCNPCPHSTGSKTDADGQGAYQIS
eukprot:1947847-Pyramimonas_sp.AAC.1